MSKKICIFILFLPMIFLFLQSFYIIPLKVPVYDIIIAITFAFLLYSDKFLLKYIIFFSQITVVRILMLYIIWVISTGFILLLLGFFSISNFIYGVLLLFLYNNIVWFLYPALIFPRIFSLKSLSKYLFVAIYIICVYGLLQYFLSKNGIYILDYVQNIITNRRLASNEILNGLRVYSVFEEPGYLGGFLCINIPLIYNLALSEFQLFKNLVIDFILKKTIIPILWITLIFAKSPIWFIFAIIVSVIYLYKYNKVKFIYTIITILTIILLSLTLNSAINKDSLSDSFLIRIYKTLISFTKPEEFVVQEPSLFNRVIGYSTRFKIFLKYPITGVGYKNAEYHSYKPLLELNLPLTQETINTVARADERIVTNGSILFNALSDTGLFGTILFYTFMLYNIIFLKKIIKHIPKSLESDLAYGIKNACIVMICVSFYDIRSNFVYFWFLFGLTLSFVIYCIKQKNLLKKEVE